MRLALFDLDRTLLPIDSADDWSRFVVRSGGLDPARYGARIREFADTYAAGCFDALAYLDFQMGLLTRLPRAQLERLRAEFVRARVLPHVRREAVELVDTHRRAGDELAVVTGTNAFVARPIADAFGIEHLLAVEPEERDGEFTGRHVGTHSHGEGKVRKVEAFLAQRGTALERCESLAFYSDSIVDLPLLERVAAAGGRAVVTNGDAGLRAVAAARGWPVLELFARAA
jgi:HAD superfamily hydrolase (TIGR01490 family)